MFANDWTNTYGEAYRKGLWNKFCTFHIHKELIIHNQEHIN